MIDGMDEVVWDVERMRTVVTRWDDFVRNDAGPDADVLPWRPEIVQRSSVLREAATEDQIRAAEARLEVTLPTSYRSFLQVSDGAYASASLGAEYESDKHGYLGVEDVVPVRVGHPEWVRTWCTDDEAPPSEDRLHPSQVIELDRFAAGADGLLITHVSEVFFEILVPREGEWELWSAHKEGATAYHCFAEHMQWAMRFPRFPRPAPLDL